MDAATTPAGSSLDVDAALLAVRLGVDTVHDVAVEPVDYPLEMMTTGGRWWVSGVAHDADGSRPVRVFVKLVRTVRDSPVMAFIPPELRALTEETLPWYVEPDVYRSDLAAALPAGTRMPRLLGVDSPDETSALMWLEAVDAAAGPWTSDDWHAAAHALGRLSTSPGIIEVADVVGHPVGPIQARAYWNGRLVHQFAAAYRAGDVWQHPLVDRHVRPDLRQRLLALLDRCLRSWRRSRPCPSWPATATPVRTTSCARATGSS